MLVVVVLVVGGGGGVGVVVVLNGALIINPYEGLYELHVLCRALKPRSDLAHQLLRCPRQRKKQPVNAYEET